MDELRDEIIKFQKERDWKKFHTPENLEIGRASCRERV